MRGFNGKGIWKRVSPLPYTPKRGRQTLSRGRGRGRGGHGWKVIGRRVSIRVVRVAIIGGRGVARLDAAGHVSEPHVALSCKRRGLETKEKGRREDGKAGRQPHGGQGIQNCDMPVSTRPAARGPRRTQPTLSLQMAFGEEISWPARITNACLRPSERSERRDGRAESSGRSGSGSKPRQRRRRYLAGLLDRQGGTGGRRQRQPATGADEDRGDEERLAIQRDKKGETASKKRGDGVCWRGEQSHAGKGQGREEGGERRRRFEGGAGGGCRAAAVGASRTLARWKERARRRLPPAACRLSRASCRLPPAASRLSPCPSASAVAGARAMALPWQSWPEMRARPGVGVVDARRRPGSRLARPRPSSPVGGFSDAARYAGHWATPLVLVRFLVGPGASHLGPRVSGRVSWRRRLSRRPAACLGYLPALPRRRRRFPVCRDAVVGSRGRCMGFRGLVRRAAALATRATAAPRQHPDGAPFRPRKSAAVAPPPRGAAPPADAGRLLGAAAWRTRPMLRATCPCATAPDLHQS